MINDIALSVYARVMSAIASFKEERGQDLIEYAVLAGAIGIVAAIALIGAESGGWLDFGEFKRKVQDCVEFGDACGW